MATAKTDGDQIKGRFKKGQSGNPAGRPKGSKHRASVLAQALLDGRCEELVNKAVQMALDGDRVALRHAWKGWWRLPRIGP